VAIDTRTGHAFVANAQGDSVSVLDTATGVLRHTIAVGTPVAVVAVDARRGHAFVGTIAGGTVRMLDAQREALLRVTALARRLARGAWPLMSRSHACS
jgi:YVTN family beta-propeller protein